MWSSLEHGIGCATAGGTHHAFADRGEGYCVLNDLAICSNRYLASFPTHRVFIADLDVHQVRTVAENSLPRKHIPFVSNSCLYPVTVWFAGVCTQGNGTAVLLADKPNVYTYSIQCQGNYFSKIQKSTQDVDVPIGAGYVGRSTVSTLAWRVTAAAVARAHRPRHACRLWSLRNRFLFHPTGTTNICNCWSVH